MKYSSKPKLSPEILVAIDAGIKAAVEIKKIYDNAFSSELHDGNPITEADIASNRIIKKILNKTAIGILSEEDLDDFSRLSQQKIWIVDPLDGTSDFINRTGEFSILIGLVDKNVPLGGVIYQPIGDVLYVAEKGRGAYRYKSGIWTKLAVSLVTELSKAKVIMSRHHLSSKDDKFLRGLGVNNYVQRGSSGLKVASIAEGMAELYFTSTDKIKQWDTCAAYCLITEAGGEMTDVFGQNLVYNIDKINHEHGIFASNGKFTPRQLGLCQ